MCPITTYLPSCLFSSHSSSGMYLRRPRKTNSGEDRRSSARHAVMRLLESDRTYSYFLFRVNSQKDTYMTKQTDTSVPGDGPLLREPSKDDSDENDMESGRFSPQRRNSYDSVSSVSSRRRKQKQLDFDVRLGTSTFIITRTFQK